MGYSKIQICNSALLAIGQSQIQALTELSAEAVYCKAFYDSARKQLLREQTWNFATKVIELARLSEDPVDFDYSYALPADVVKVIGPVYNQGLNTNPEGSMMYYPQNRDDAFNPRAIIKQVKFEIRANASGDKILVTDEAEFHLKYIYDCDDPNKYDSLFVECLSYLLASKIAGPITGDPKVSEYMVNVYNTFLIKARAEDAAENRFTDHSGMDFLNARF